jgi:hypothetical protein
MRLRNGTNRLLRSGRSTAGPSQLCHFCNVVSPTDDVGSWGKADSPPTSRSGLSPEINVNAPACLKSDREWSRPFEDPIPLPRGRQLATLKDAADFIMKLPKAEQELPEWQLATSCLIQAAEGRGPLMHARMGATHFLTKTLPKVTAEMALSVLAYNLTRVMNIVGTKPLAAIAA